MERTVLKRSRAREVRVDVDARGSARVVKRFESPGRLAGLLDRRRAAREFELLAFLGAEGLPVPRALDVVRRGRGFEVASEHLPGRRTLAERLEAGDVPALAAFRELGAALGRLFELAIDHPDLHPGNVLVGERDEIALIDFHAARRAAKPDPARLARDVVSFEAALRERAPLAARRALLEAWLANVGSAARRVPTGAELDRAARARRREIVAARERRWLRAGSAVERIEGGFARHGVPRRVVDELSRAREAIAVEGRHFAVVEGGSKDVVAAWLASARLEEHALAVAKPAVLLRRAKTRAAFELANDVRPPSKPMQRERAAATLLGALHDRGLWLPELAAQDLRVDATGRPFLVAPRALAAWPKRRGWLARTGLALDRSSVERPFLTADRGHDDAHAREALSRA
ncbi:MAG: hypothetical protein K8S98_03425 [Planctomycetes bacterium]|nr:hypothetical protein [Planctomycetota bacterium]